VISDTEALQKLDQEAGSARTKEEKS